MNWQEQMQESIAEIKNGFQGSDDYKSGINDAIYTILTNMIEYPNSQIFRQAEILRGNYQKKEDKRTNPMLRCDKIAIVNRATKIMAFSEFLEYVKEYYGEFESGWHGRLFGQPFTHENDALYLIQNPTGEMVRFHDDEILVIDFILDEIHFSTMTKHDFYRGRAAGWFVLGIHKVGEVDWNKYNP